MSDNGVTIEQIADRVGHRTTIVTPRQREHALTPKNQARTRSAIRSWPHSSFAPSDAVEAKEMGVPLEAAVAWREAGFILPDAALLIHDGWTLEEAVNARYEGIADEDWYPNRTGD